MGFPEPARRGGAARAIGWIVSRQVFWIFVATLLTCLLLSLASDKFATPQNLFNVTRNFAFVAIIAIGMTAVIITGGIDLSVGSVVWLSGMILGVVMNAGHSIGVGIAAALLAALAAGLTNGVLIAYVRMPPFVVTLGMLSVARSLAMILSSNKMVYAFGPDQATLLALGGGTTLGIANPVLALAAIALAAGFVFRWTRWGRHIFAIGGNEQAANLTGVPVARVKVQAYILCSLSASLAAILSVGWSGSANNSLDRKSVV